MDNQHEALKQSLEQYESQLSQIREAISSSSNDVNKEDLYSLEKDIIELISLTKDTLGSKSPLQQTSTSDSQCDEFSDEYALFKAELAELEGVSNPGKAEEKESADDHVATVDKALEDDLHALKGSKCQAPYKRQWGVESYYNALIVDIETNDNVTDMEHIQVRVLFVNPMEKDMMPCPYYLDGECRFSDDKCHFSHGQLVPLSDIKEYREPDFSSVREGSQVLAKQKDNLWHRAKVKNILNNNRCSVQFESKGCETVELDLHDLLPLNSDCNDDSDGSSSGSDSEDVVPQDYFVQLSLLRTPSNVALGAWEKHTKGIGSRLMANMGYVVGCGLGKYGEGRLEPVEAMAYPPGKSLDACMALREAAGGDQNMFKAERRQKKEQQRLLKMQKRQEIKQSQKIDVFSFINKKLSGTPDAKSTPSNQKNLASSSRKGLNVERFRLGEDIKRVQKDVNRITQSLQRHEQGSATHKAINCKLKEAQSELSRLQNSDKAIAQEQGRRDGNKKMAVF